jgi:protein-L-isoaspartate(D-aspartate) O-methyltransferase
LGLNEVTVFEEERRAMVETQLRRRGIRDARVLQAMLAVPRHEFVPPDVIGLAYEDRPVPIGSSQTISQPYMVAAMTEAVQVRRGDRVLEIGSGTGYQAAVLDQLGAKVFTMERDFELVQSAHERLKRLGYANVEVVWGDGTEGHPPEAPYDVILVTAAAPQIPPPLIDQLADGGRMAIPTGKLAQQDLRLIVKSGGRLDTQVLDACQFVPLRGRYGWPEQERWLH